MTTNTTKTAVAATSKTGSARCQTAARSSRWVARNQTHKPVAIISTVRLSQVSQVFGGAVTAGT